MNKAQKETRDANVAVLARNYPNTNATKLQNDLWGLAVACERNATELCNTPNYQDRRDELRKRLKAICKKHAVALNAEVTGDPRGFCLKLHLPDGSYNSWAGKEGGYGIGS